MPAKLVALVLFTFVTIGLLIAALVALGRRSQRRHEALQAAVRRFDARIESSFWSGKSLRFEVEGVPAELRWDTGSENESAWTKIQFEWSGPPLHLAPERSWARIKKFFGAEDIQVGDPPFDDAFLIQGDHDWTLAALTPETRQLLWTLHELGATGGLFGRSKGISLDVTPAGVYLKCLRDHSWDEERLLTFLETSVQVLAALRRAQGEGVSISVAEVVRAGKCPVCSDASGDLSKRCRGCNAAYHSECWDYLGGCAIFGCEDRKPDQERAGRQRSW